MTHTPAMQQYYDMKEEYSDAILFFRMWDFYEMFAEDAHIAHKVLWINITSRNKNAEVPVALAWIPYHALDKYLPILVKAWHKVAIAEQISDPTLKGIVKREVVRVVTPATLPLEGEWYENQDTNNIACITKLKGVYGLSIVELTTNKWITWSFISIEALATEIYKAYPKEIILSKTMFEDAEIQTFLIKKYEFHVFYFESPKKSREKLLNHFWVKNLHGFWIDNKESCILSSATILEYLTYNQKSQLDHLDCISYSNFDWYMWLDESTLRNLDILYNFSTSSTKQWTLIWIIDKTKTPMGKRELRENVLRPLQEQEAIEKRLEIIECFVSEKVLLDAVQLELSWISDLDAILTRLSLGKSWPRDLLQLKNSLIAVQRVVKIIQESKNQKLINLLNI